MDNTAKTFLQLWDVICTIREQCPWDQKQSLQSLASPFLEEAYEACEAVESGTAEDITEELGDVFFMNLMLVRIAQQEGFTSLEKILERATQKLIRRHPHVYGQNKAHSAEEVMLQWEELKKQEKTHRESVFDGIPKSLPSSMRIQKVLKKGKTLNWNPDPLQETSAKARLENLILQLFNEGENISVLLHEIARSLEQSARDQGL